ncbi:MAG: hypothetical protein Q3Y08_02180 [Butyricicoccus sp.]|nr:hypothetical protein [Butyricicoccus sp.]
MARAIPIDGVGVVHIAAAEIDETEQQERQRQYQRVAARLYQQALKRQKE